MGVIRILVVVIIIVVFIALAIYLMGVNIKKSTKKRYFNRWYCDKHPESLPCSFYDYSNCITDTYDKNQLQNCLNLGNLFVQVVGLLEDVPDYKIINSYNIDPKEVKGEYEPICHFYEKPNTDMGFIIVRGTDHLDGEWELDYQYGQVNLPYINDVDIKVSKGFLKAYKYFRDNLVADLIKTPNIKHLYIVGHSLGSGIIALLTADLAHNFDKTLTVFAMAPPRAGNNKFVNFITQNKNVLSYVSMINLSDLVPSLPSPLIYSFTNNQSDEYSHIGDKVVFDQNFNSFTLNHSVNLYVGTLATMLGYKDCGKYVDQMS